VIEQGIWIIRSNQEMRELYKYVDIADIKNKIFEGTGHVTIMDLGRRV